MEFCFEWHTLVKCQVGFASGDVKAAEIGYCNSTLGSMICAFP